MGWAERRSYDSIIAAKNRRKKYSESRTAGGNGAITRRDLKWPELLELVKSPQRFTTMDHRERGKAMAWRYGEEKRLVTITKWGRDKKAVAVATSPFSCNCNGLTDDSKFKHA